MPKARIFNIMQYEKHPVTGEQLWSVEQIEEGLDHKTITEWAWCYHDKDVWTEDDELQDASHVAGQHKPPHFHVAINLPKNAVEVETIARWFSVPMNFVEIARGRGAFLDCVEYLTHEAPNQQAAGKYRYPDVEVNANFDWRKLLDERALSRAKYGQEVDRKTALRLKVLNGELSLRDVKREYVLNYFQDYAMLTKLRMEYISHATPPKVRHNYYICGGGGVGKGVASILLAHSLYPNIEDEEDLLFRVGAEGTTFEGYDGQPVIIWDDCRSSDLLKKLGSRGNIFNVFDTSPHRQAQNIKFGSVNLINAVNIVNSVEPWEDFLGGLVGEYIDKYGDRHRAESNEKSQSYRRFPFIMPLRATDFDILINQAYMNGEGDYEEYIKYEGIKGNFGRLARACPDMVSTVRVGSSSIKPLLEAHDEIEARETTLDINSNEFAEFGQIGGVSTVRVGGQEIKES